MVATAGIEAWAQIIRLSFGQCKGWDYTSTICEDIVVKGGRGSTWQQSGEL